MRNAIGYVRVSTNEQDDKFGIEAQKEAILKFADENGFVIVEWAKDVISGASENKPALNSLLYSIDVKNPPYEAVIVFKYDRIAREMLQLCYAVLEFKRKNIELHSVHDDMNLEKPENKLMLAVVGYCAEKERESIKIRTSAGRLQKANGGGYAGGTVPIGYTTLHGRLVLEPSEKAVVLMIYEMVKKQKMSLNRVAEYLNDNNVKSKRGGKWTARSVKYIIDNEKFYRGYYKYGKDGKWVKGEHEALFY